MRSRRRQSGSGGTPAWLVSFTDMITLLLSFFILLQAFASTQDPELFQRGTGGFRRAIQGFGIPDWLFGKRETPTREFTQPKHPVEEDPANLQRRRLIDPEDEKIRRLFDALRRLQEMQVSDHQGPPARLLATPITFEPAEDRLGPTGRTYVADFAADLRGGRPPLIYVIGLAPDAATPVDQWHLSAARAAAVHRCLRRHLPKGLKDRGARVDSWGAGPAAPAFAEVRSGPTQTFIVFAMMESPGPTPGRTPHEEP